MGPINWLGIVVATLAFFAVGAIWYSALFAKAWQREVVVLMLGHLFARLQPSDHVKMMMATGFALAIMAPAIGINYLYQRRSLKLWLIDAGHFVVGMSVVGLVFVLLG